MAWPRSHCEVLKAGGFQNLIRVNSSCPKAQNIKHLCYSYTKIDYIESPYILRLVQLTLGIDEANLNDDYLQSAMGCDELNSTGNWAF